MLNRKTRPDTMIDFFLNEGPLRPADAAAALIVVGENEHYLMQLRDQKPDIFYPGHWGLFGGAMEHGETPVVTLRRELKEELLLTVDEILYFTEFVFDFGCNGFSRCIRQFFEVRVPESALSDLVLGEGIMMRTFAAHELLTGPRVVPFDAFAVWMHATRKKVSA